jgi:hypothetical protein
MWGWLMRWAELILQPSSSSGSSLPATPSATGSFKEEMLEPAMFIGLGFVAVWAHLRFPRLRPRSLLRAILHVAVAFAMFALLPAALGFLLPLAPSPAQAWYMVVALLIPALTYLLLSWVWLLARILHDLFGGIPRGGHPVSNES